MKMKVILLVVAILLGLFFYSCIVIFHIRTYTREVIGNTPLLRYVFANERAATIDSYNEERQIFFLLEYLLQDSSSKATKELEALVMEETVVGYLANVALAEKGVESGITADVFYRRALNLYYTKEAHYQLAAWLTENSYHEEAIAEYLLLLPDKKALEALEQLDAPIMEISRALAKSNQRQGAVDYISKILQSQSFSPSNRIELLTALGQSYAQMGQYAKAIPYLREVYDGGDRSVAFWYARSLEGTGALQTASSIYREMGPSGAQRLGNILLQQGQTEEAAQVLSESDNPMARWQSAITWERLSQTEKALGIYLQLARETSRYTDDAAYRAYILLERKGLQEAEEMLEILQEYPAWAIRLTGEARFRVDGDLVAETPPFLKSVEALEELGHHDWAKIELAIGQARVNNAEILALGDWFFQREDFYISAIWGIRSLNRTKTPHGYLLAYPRPYKELVLETASKYRIDPHLIWAVMREESLFRPQVASVAGALGLMQVMPATGQEIAGRLGMRISNQDLLRPEISIEFGAFYIRQMLNMFNEDVDKALAAYNGGPGNVQRWSSSPLGTTPADFPTAITFVETRNYITKVLETYYTYNWLYGSYE